MKPQRRAASQLEHNVQSIWAIPDDQLPMGPARDWLLNQAWQGKDVEAYVPYQPGVPTKEREWWLFLGDKRCSVLDFYRGFNTARPVISPLKDGK